MILRVKKANVSGAKKKSGSIKRAIQVAITMAARRDTEQFVPKITSALRDTAHHQSNLEKGELIYGDGRVTYARPQYYGCPNKTLQGTTMKWFEHAKPIYLSIWLREGEEAAKEAVQHG